MADAVGLAVVLAAADALLHADLGSLIDTPSAAARSLSWLIIAYAAIVLAVALTARSRSTAAAVIASGTILAQGVFSLYRAPSGNTGIQLLLLIAVLVTAAAIAWLTHRLVGRSRIPLHAARFLAVCGGMLMVGCFLAPTSPPVPPGKWPDPPEAAHNGAEASTNLLLITLDTVRADHLPAYGYRKVRTPNLDQLARQGAVFRRALAQAPLTPVSHASILTGVYPIRHGVRSFDASQTLAQVPLLSEILREEGWLTGAIIASEALHPRYGLARGFDVYHFAPSPSTYPFESVFRALLPQVLSRVGLVHDRSLYRPGHEITDDAVRWLDTYGHTRFFLWVHYFDAHDPYLADTTGRRKDLHPGTGWLDRFRITFAYDSEIVGLDDQIGRLTEALRQRNLLDQTIVTILSDHGDGLGDHSYLGHTRRLYQEQLHIPLIIRCPKRIPAGSDVDLQVRSVDLLPSLLELLRIPVPDGIDGSSLIPLLDPNRSASDRVSFAETLAPSRSTDKLFAVSDGRYKLIRSLTGDAGWLFDLHEDPDERNNLKEERPTVFRRLEKQLDDYLRRSAAKASEAAPSDLDPSQRRRLQALGYLDE
jgi:arylsulfatase A-like enzyme